MNSIWAWVIFAVVVLALLAVDLGIFNRKAHTVSVREAARWSAFMVVLALAFNAGVLYFLGQEKALEFLTGYLIELALSVDNIFVFVLIFAYFQVPAKYQHRVLFWGVLGALVMRGLMIGAGALLLARFEWIIYVFGAFLVFTGIRMAVHDEMQIEPGGNPVLKLLRRAMPVSDAYDGQNFFTRTAAGRRAATPLFIVLVLVETTDLVFAVDSIPAIFAVTRDPFLVYTSNVFAILGLRSMYFLLADMVQRFHYLRLGLSAVLVFIGGKMLAGLLHREVPIAVSLAVVAGLLGISVVASLLLPPPHAECALPEDGNAAGPDTSAGGGSGASPSEGR